MLKNDMKSFHLFFCLLVYLVPDPSSCDLLGGLSSTAIKGGGGGGAVDPLSRVFQNGPRRPGGNSGSGASPVRNPDILTTVKDTGATRAIVKPVRRVAPLPPKAGFLGGGPPLTAKQRKQIQAEKAQKEIMDEMKKAMAGMMTFDDVDNKAPSIFDDPESFSVTKDKKPEGAVKIPEVAAKIPEVSAKIQEVEKIPAKIPEAETVQEKLPERIPEVVKIPERTVPEVEKVSEKIPEVESIPERVAEVPEKAPVPAPEVNKVSSRISEIEKIVGIEKNQPERSLENIPESVPNLEKNPEIEGHVPEARKPFKKPEISKNYLEEISEVDMGSAAVQSQSNAFDVSHPETTTQQPLPDVPQITPGYEKVTTESSMVENTPGPGPDPIQGQGQGHDTSKIMVTTPDPNQGQGQTNPPEPQQLASSTLVPTPQEVVETTTESQGQGQGQDEGQSGGQESSTIPPDPVVIDSSKLKVATTSEQDSESLNFQTGLSGTNKSRSQTYLEQNVDRYFRNNPDLSETGTGAMTPDKEKIETKVFTEKDLLQATKDPQSGKAVRVFDYSKGYAESDKELTNKDGGAYNEKLRTKAAVTKGRDESGADLKKGTAFLNRTKAGTAVEGGKEVEKDSLGNMEEVMDGMFKSYAEQASLLVDKDTGTIKGQRKKGRVGVDGTLKRINLINGLAEEKGKQGIELAAEKGEVSIDKKSGNVLKDTSKSGFVLTKDTDKVIKNGRFAGYPKNPARGETRRFPLQLPLVPMPLPETVLGPPTTRRPFRGFGPGLSYEKSVKKQRAEKAAAAEAERLLKENEVGDEIIAAAMPPPMRIPGPRKPFRGFGPGLSYEKSVKKQRAEKAAAAEELENYAAAIGLPPRPVQMKDRSIGGEEAPAGPAPAGPAPAGPAPAGPAAAGPAAVGPAAAGPAPASPAAAGPAPAGPTKIKAVETKTTETEEFRESVKFRGANKAAAAQRRRRVRPQPPPRKMDSGWLSLEYILRRSGLPPPEPEQQYQYRRPAPRKTAPLPAKRQHLPAEPPRIRGNGNGTSLPEILFPLTQGDVSHPVMPMLPPQRRRFQPRVPQRLSVTKPNPYAIDNPQSPPIKRRLRHKTTTRPHTGNGNGNGTTAFNSKAVERDPNPYAIKTLPREEKTALPSVPFVTYLSSPKEGPVSRRFPLPPPGRFHGGKVGAVANARAQYGQARSMATAIDKVGPGAVATALDGSDALATAHSTKAGDARTRSDTLGNAKSNSLASGGGQGFAAAISRGNGNSVANAVSKLSAAEATSFAMGEGNSQANTVSDKEGTASSYSAAFEGGNSTAAAEAMGRGAAQANSFTAEGGHSAAIASTRGDGDAIANSKARHGGNSHSISMAGGKGHSESNSVTNEGGNAIADSFADEGDSEANAIADDDEDDILASIQSIIAGHTGQSWPDHFPEKEPQAIEEYGPEAVVHNEIGPEAGAGGEPAAHGAGAGNAEAGGEPAAEHGEESAVRHVTEQEPAVHNNNPPADAESGQNVAKEDPPAVAVHEVVAEEPAVENVVAVTADEETPAPKQEDLSTQETDETNDHDNRQDSPQHSDAIHPSDSTHDPPETKSIIFY